MRGYITAKQEFLYPDTELGVMLSELELVSAQNGKIGIQVLFQCFDECGKVCIEGEGFQTEYFQLIDIPVEYNTGDGIEQEGAMVISPPKCPDYAIRQAPFRVYDCLRPMPDGVISSVNKRVAVYICLSPEEGILAGKYKLCMRVIADGTEHICNINVQVFSVSIDENRFQQTNWFSLESLELCHGVQPGTQEYFDMVRSYARAMRRIHQRIICLPMSIGPNSQFKEPPYYFDFEHLKPIIKLFFEEGFDTLEAMGLLTCGNLPDGKPDIYTDVLKCVVNPEIPVDSDKGFEILNCMMRDYAAFLRRNNWQHKVLMHIYDEPDDRFASEVQMQAKRMQYFMTANIVRKHLPTVKIIEAVKTTLFRGAIDILVPLTNGYQKEKKAFDTAAAVGDEIWTYVCCVPEGFWLNRFLDQPLVNGRLIFWGCAANHIKGLLHWGFNMFSAGVPNPFMATSCHNHTGAGTNFPCGDAFIVYPGENGPWLSMRMEANRRGAEDAALLDALYHKNPKTHEELVSKVFKGFDQYDNDPERMELVFKELLERLAD